ncbi:Predicted dehydrogenase [Saccharopolyspora kobensis]|uniref:Predicted dehydrogenase n=1 Tax=Saccharopolyspora kobensis TaxID=146035 RepID=A0A1H5URH4_9PSEU|nr:Gfo/Idh/MocA family oxidoreductase [Saccharopolyspora kobensis]SEF77639.1 Predicted dehydrogenase [Saccharopolyspora kobensis]SFC70362.1 Predicted dehydrogenase [Saccharopolyspora kobensis]
MSPIRVGVIGIGWAGQQHLAAYRDLPDVEIVAIAGKEPELLRSLGEQYGATMLFESWEKLLEVPDLDAVSIAVPTFLHAPIAIAALKRGLHVLSEKPLARNGVEGQQMVEAARSAGRVLDVVFNHRLRGDIQALGEIIGRGDLGRPYYAKASWMRRRGIPLLGSWFTNQEMSGGGPLADIGVHVLDYALFLLGEPRVLSVNAVTYSELGHRGIGGMKRETADQSVSEYEVEDFAAAFVRLEGGATLVLETSWAAFRSPDDLIDFSVLGTDGGAELKAVGATKAAVGDLHVYRDADGEIADYQPAAEPGRAHAGVVENFIDVLRDQARWPANDGSLALKRARVIDACYQSAAENKEIVVE